MATFVSVPPFVRQPVKVCASAVAIPRKKNAEPAIIFDVEVTFIPPLGTTSGAASHGDVCYRIATYLGPSKVAPFSSIP